VALLAGQAYYLKRRLQSGEAVKGGVVGFLAGAVAGAIAQSIYGGIGANEVLRIICWGIAGGLLGYGLSFRIPNVGGQRGLLGGAVGGVIGGGLFIALTFGLRDDVVGRLVGVTAIGFCIGLMIALVEAVLREVWLEVRYGPKEARVVSLGREPVSIGGDRACTIYAQNAPPLALRYRLEEGRIVCEDVVQGRTMPVSPADRRVVGPLTITVCASQQASPPVSPLAAAPAPRPAPARPGPKESFVLRLSSGQVIALAQGVRLRGRDLAGLEAAAGDGVVAAVVPNPQDPTVLGLQNLSQRAWGVTLVQGGQRQVEVGRSLRLAAGTKIDFGGVEGNIQ
jgi:hypothetical protein